MDPRDALRLTGRIMDKESAAAEVASGTMPADTILPLFAGVVNQAFRSILRAIPHESYTEFDDVSARPMVATIRLQDGSKVHIHLDAEPAS